MDHFFSSFLSVPFELFSILQFGSVTEQASNLVHIPQNFDLELYAERRLQKVSVLYTSSTS